MESEETAAVPELLDVAKMAKRAGVTRGWLFGQARAGTIPAVKVGKMRYLFLPIAVQEALVAMATPKKITAKLKKDSWYVVLWKWLRRLFTSGPPSMYDGPYAPD